MSGRTASASEMTFSELLESAKDYKNEHTPDNLKKVCNAIADICARLYASTSNEDDRLIYIGMIHKISTKE